MPEHIRVSKQAVRAHNARMEFPCFNEAYNAAHGLGSMAERSALRHVAIDRHGYDGGAHKLSAKDLREYCPPVEVI